MRAGSVFNDVRQKRLLVFVAGLVSVTSVASMVHPFGRVKDISSSAPLLGDFGMNSPVTVILSKSCQDCHSEKTDWPVYSYVAPMSWMMEKDVGDARRHLDLSRWLGYDPAERRQILSEIASLVRNRRMPLGRYLLLHPEARLSASEADQLDRWTRSERKRLKDAAP